MLAVQDNHVKIKVQFLVCIFVAENPQTVHAYVHSLLLFYARATVFHLYHGGNMMYEIRRRTPEPTPLLTQGIFNLQHHIGMV